MRGLLTSFLLLLSTCAIQVSSGSLSVYGNALGLIPPGGFFLGDKSYAAVIDEEAQFAYYGNFLSSKCIKLPLSLRLSKFLYLASQSLYSCFLQLGYLRLT